MTSHRAVFCRSAYCSHTLGDSLLTLVSLKTNSKWRFHGTSPFTLIESSNWTNLLWVPHSFSIPAPQQNGHYSSFIIPTIISVLPNLDEPFLFWDTSTHYIFSIMFPKSLAAIITSSIYKNWNHHRIRPLLSFFLLPYTTYNTHRVIFRSLNQI